MAPSAFNQIFGVTREGNFYDPHNPELLGRNVLSRRTDPFPATSGLDRDAFDARMGAVADHPVRSSRET